MAVFERWTPEGIGNPDCPVMRRWILVETRWFRIAVHHFPANGVEDDDPHDHPRGFVTIILRGAYIDERANGHPERMTTGMVRYRPAAYAHRVHASATGCWTLTLQGAQTRTPGYWRDGVWINRKAYLARFGRNGCA
jgi:hypothetical protein